MKISKSKLKRIIKEELEALINEQEDRISIMQALQAAGIAVQRHDPSSKLSDALANAVNKGAVTKERGLELISNQYKKYIGQARNELDSAVRQAGGSDKYVQKMMAGIAKFFNKKASGGEAEKPQDASSPGSKPSRHHRDMKKNARQARADRAAALGAGMQQSAEEN